MALLLFDYPAVPSAAAGRKIEGKKQQAPPTTTLFSLSLSLGGLLLLF
jgi:hypothetical protein